MSKTVMVVDDSSGVRQIVSFVVRNSGYEVIEAEDGLDALAKLDGQSSISLIITDLCMPRLDGIELIKTVRNHKVHGFTPIIMITTEWDESKRSEGQKAGATDWIPKPFRPEQLMEVVTRILA
jgi:two-component system chemotaxis response regulator CheY